MYFLLEVIAFTSTQNVSRELLSQQMIWNDDVLQMERVKFVRTDSCQQIETINQK